MTRAELIRKFPNASPDFIAANCSDGSRPGQRAELQEQKAERGENQRHGLSSDGEKDKAMDAASHGAFRVAISLRFSDRRRRDPDGCASTLLDCLIAARRLLDGDSAALGDERDLRAGARGRNDND